MIWTLPNVLTILRLIAAPAIAMMYLFLARPYADWAVLALFVGASLTDWVDGYIARAWNQQSRFGAMLDPIADKAMVVIALMTLVALWGMSALIVVPTALILFREVFVSGLREYLGDRAGTLKVTRLAKWKTTAQMLSIAVLFASGLFEHYLGMLSYGMDAEIVTGILDGTLEDVNGLRWKHAGWVWTTNGGIALLWVAAVLTLVTGWDYFRKSLPYLKEPQG